MAVYQCSCGKTYTSKTLAMAHMATAAGNHIVKRVG